MSMHLKNKVEKIERVLAKLVDESSNGKLIIVEGKKDIQTLQSLGVSGPILTLKTGGKSFLDVIAEIELLGTNEIILLLDFDRRGKEGTKRLKCDLERLKIRVNVTFWCELHRLVGHEIQSIESLDTYLKNLHEKTSQM